MNEKTLQELRDVYRPGIRVELIQTATPRTLPLGTRGTVQRVDDAGYVYVDWDNDSKTAILCPEKRCRVLVGECTQRVREQIQAIRDKSVVNMYDISAVQQLASLNGFSDLVIFLVDHRREYLDYIAHLPGIGKKT